MASSAPWATAAGNFTTNVQRCGGSGVDDSGPDSGAAAAAFALIAPSVRTISPPREVSAARAASSVTNLSRGRPMRTCSGSATSMAMVSRSSRATVSPLVSTSESGVPGWRPARAWASASGAK